MGVKNFAEAGRKYSERAERNHFRNATRSLMNARDVSTLEEELESSYWDSIEDHEPMAKGSYVFDDSE